MLVKSTTPIRNKLVDKATANSSILHTLVHQRDHDRRYKKFVIEVEVFQVVVDVL